MGEMASERASGAEAESRVLHAPCWTNTLSSKLLCEREIKRLTISRTKHRPYCRDIAPSPRSGRWVGAWIDVSSTVSVPAAVAVAVATTVNILH